MIKLNETDRFRKTVKVMSSRAIIKYGLDKAIFVYDRADWKCEKCGSENNISITTKGKRENEKVNNLAVICRKCLGSISSKKGWKMKRKGVLQ